MGRRARIVKRVFPGHERAPNHLGAHAVNGSAYASSAGMSWSRAQPRMSAAYARPRASGLPPVPAGYVGAVVDSLIRNDGARDIDVRGRGDGLYDVARLA